MRVGKTYAIIDAGEGKFVEGLVTKRKTSELRPSEYPELSKKQQQKMLKEVRAEGNFRDPVFVVVKDGAETKVLVGNNRLKIARQLKLPEVETVEVSLPFRKFKTNLDLDPDLNRIQ